MYICTYGNSILIEKAFLQLIRYIYIQAAWPICLHSHILVDNVVPLLPAAELMSRKPAKHASRKENCFIFPDGNTS